jgi:CheY-like chemotaxis protein
MNKLEKKINMNILVVDDDESMRYLVQSKLSAEGFQVTVAGSGAHALQILQTNKKFDLIITDLHMPLKGGFEIVRFMKERSISVPVIIVTGVADRSTIIVAAQLGIQDVLVKPIRQADLMKVVRGKLGIQDEDEQAEEEQSRAA